jgi:hypothetical protein
MTQYCIAYAGQSDADARRGCHSGVSSVHPTNVSTATQQNSHLQRCTTSFAFSVLMMLSESGLACDCGSRIHQASIRQPLLISYPLLQVSVARQSLISPVR